MSCAADKKKKYEYKDKIPNKALFIAKKTGELPLKTPQADLPRMFGLSVNQEGVNVAKVCTSVRDVCKETSRDAILVAAKLILKQKLKTDDETLNYILLNDGQQCLASLMPDLIPDMETLENKGYELLEVGSSTDITHEADESVVVCIKASSQIKRAVGNVTTSDSKAKGFRETELKIKIRKNQDRKPWGVDVELMTASVAYNESLGDNLMKNLAAQTNQKIAALRDEVQQAGYSQLDDVVERGISQLSEAEKIVEELLISLRVRDSITDPVAGGIEKYAKEMFWVSEMMALRHVEVKAKAYKELVAATNPLSTPIIIQQAATEFIAAEAEAKRATESIAGFAEFVKKSKQPPECVQKARELAKKLHNEILTASTVIIDVDLSRLPEQPISPEEAKNSTTTFGCMYGNALKVLWSLIEAGAATCDQDTLTAMNKLYYSQWPDVSREKTQENIKQFNDLLDKVTFTEGANVRFLGDIVADRGQCDYLTLRILNKAKEKGVALEIIQSNHDAVFQEYLADAPSISEKLNSYSIYNSILAMDALIQQGAVTKDDIKILYKDVYKQSNSLRLVSYELSSDGVHIDVYMHAPNSVTVIADLCAQIEQASNALRPRSANTENTAGLAAMIDYINQQYESLTPEQMATLQNTNGKSSNNKKRASAYYKITDGRANYYADQKVEIPDWCTIHHGHDSFSALSHNAITYDNDVGQINLLQECGVALYSTTDPDLESLSYPRYDETKGQLQTKQDGLLITLPPEAQAACAAYLAAAKLKNQSANKDIRCSDSEIRRNFRQNILPFVRCQVLKDAKAEELHNRGEMKIRQSDTTLGDQYLNRVNRRMVTAQDFKGGERQYEMLMNMTSAGELQYGAKQMEKAYKTLMHKDRGNTGKYPWDIILLTNLVSKSNGKACYDVRVALPECKSANDPDYIRGTTKKKELLARLLEKLKDTDGLEIVSYVNKIKKQQPTGDPEIDQLAALINVHRKGSLGKTQTFKDFEKVFKGLSDVNTTDDYKTAIKAKINDLKPTDSVSVQCTTT